jgi:hypothetical protein
MRTLRTKRGFPLRKSKYPDRRHPIADGQTDSLSLLAIPNCSGSGCATVPDNDSNGSLGFSE